MGSFMHTPGPWGLLGPCAESCGPCSEDTMSKRSTPSAWAKRGRCPFCGRPTIATDPVIWTGPKGQQMRRHADCAEARNRA